jgi:hypothetical protein
MTRQIEERLPSWSMAPPVVKASQAMLGVALLVAVTIVAEVGDFRRFAHARQLMAYLDVGAPAKDRTPPSRPFAAVVPEARFGSKRNPFFPRCLGQDSTR